MALKQNTIYVYFKGKHLVTSKSQYQYNHGQFLYFADLDLPQTFEVHFSNRDRGDSKPQVGSNKLVEIPDEYYWSGALMIYAWIYLHTGKDDGETVYEVRIPLSKRAKPTDEEPLPQQQGVIDRTIAELNNAVNVTTENANKTEADKTQVASIKDEVVTLKENIDSTATTVTQKAQEAVNAANASETSAQNAAGYENNAHNYSDEARQYAESALESKNITNQKSEIATNASAEAMGYRNEALEAKNQAIQAKQNIVDYRDETKGYRDETLTTKDDVQTIKMQIEGISDTVNENAQSASQSASSASQSANSANQSASSASQSANSASQSAIQAEQFKNQSEANVTHYPKVINNYWYVWDAVNEEYVNTNVDAHGVKGDKGEDGSSGVYMGSEEPTDENVNLWVDTNGSVTGIINDVQVNGTSIVNNGVANVPVISANNETGLVPLGGAGSGLCISGGVLAIYPAPSIIIKNGTAGFQPITPYIQHESVFYGLAKVAGHDEKNSALSVGTYTPEAQTAIRTMLGLEDVYQDYSSALTALGVIE